VEDVMNALTASKKSEVQAWEAEVTPCEHTLTLEQQQPPKPLTDQGNHSFAYLYQYLLTSS
jgi:ubiquitin carboxyl-terminal hydrolase 5/13